MLESSIRHGKNITGAQEAEKRSAMTVLINVDTSKQVGDKDHLKVFANQDAASVIFVSKFAWLQPPIYFVTLW